MAAPIHTFVFADLVGFTALAESEGDDRALEVVLGLQRHVRALLNDHCAEQVKAIGDGVMLRCDRADAAIALGLRLVDELAAEEGFPPVRVGVHTGPALASDGDWYGAAVNVAARLCTVAPGGEVLVSEAARAAAEPEAEVEWGEREHHWLRGVSQPIATFLAAPPSEPAARSARTERPSALTAITTAARLGAFGDPGRVLDRKRFTPRYESGSEARGDPRPLTAPPATRLVGTLRLATAVRPATALKPAAALKLATAMRPAAATRLAAAVKRIPALGCPRGGGEAWA